MSDQVNLFTDLFEEEREKERLRELITPLWKKIARFLIVFGLLFWSGSVIFLDFEIACVQVTCERPVNKVYYKSKTTYAKEVVCEAIYQDGDYAGEPSSMKCVADGEEFEKCECTNKDLKITSPYFDIFKTPREISGGYSDHPMLSYFDDEPEEFKSYKDFDKINEFMRPLHGNERLY